ncbi:MAG: hypothetical protein LBG72_09975 [Spirochaetaceae bacterium]|jgi:hypothetical protein|nr:hypothetical protein [Spirochaetaceae bacterium]
MLLDFIFQPDAVKTFALVGPSGTGKSFQAKFVARKQRIDLIIDDGLLIRHASILAGHSAKKEKSFMAAVKAALFDDKTRRDEVARVLQDERYKRILILGTSEKMVNKIAARLQLPLPSKIIRIEDVTSQKDIENARRIRAVEGKHVIPVPGVEVKRAYPSIFFEVIRIFRRKMVSGALTVPESHEKSVVTPSYSRPNELFISETALSLMVKNCVDEYNPKFAVRGIEIKRSPEGSSESKPGCQVVITLDIPLGTQLENTITGLSAYIVENIEHFTGILVAKALVIIDKTLEM